MINNNAWFKSTCPVCGEDCWRGPEALYKVCYECRTEMGLKTDADVEELLEFFNQMAQADVKELQVQTKKKREDNRWGSFRTPVTPKTDPEKVAMGVRAMTHYGLIPDEGLSKDTNFVFAKNGAFEVRHSDVADIVLGLSPAGTTIPGLTNTLTPGVRFNLPPVPFEMLAQTVAFFRGVMAKFNNAEAIVRIWWNVAEKRYDIRVPTGGQQVSGAAVHHQDTFDLDGARDAEGRLLFLHVMDIHSHNNMSGFWSGVDDNDERKAPEGRMFGVMGKVTQVIPDWKWRMRSREGFIELKVSDIFAVPEQAFEFTSKMTLKELIVSPFVQATMECKHDPFAGASCPEEWYATVNQPRHSQQGRLVGFTGGQGGHRPHDPHIKTYIYVKTGDLLEEFEVTEEKTIPTGVTCDLKGASK